jgi:hypothetical protein
LAPQHEQLGIGGEDLAQSVLEGAASINASAHVLDPILGNPFDSLLTVGHEGQRPGGVALPHGAVAGRLPAAGVADGKGTGEELFGEMELLDEGEFALPQPGGLGTFGLGYHLGVILLQEYAKCQHHLRMRK